VADLNADIGISTRGAQESLVESFGIVGLYGYRSISLSSEYAATILIARNGSGKTTLLGALDAFLRGQFSRLRDLQFSEIRCKLRSIESDLILTHEDVISFVDLPADGDLGRFASIIEVETAALFRFIIENYEDRKNDWRALRDDNVFSAILRNSAFHHLEAISVCDKLRESILGNHPQINKIYVALRAALKDIDIVYLPTYRRIELPLSDASNEDAPNRRKKRRFRAAGSSLFTGDIQFGLGDISDRLSELNQTILLDSNEGYRQISANIINELLDGTFEKQVRLFPMDQENQV
jgi:energy-coupling factor transporter ATP-binding protein EcfA2